MRLLATSGIGLVEIVEATRHFRDAGSSPLSLMCQICRARDSGAKTARGVGVQLMSVLGDSIDTIRQQCRPGHIRDI